MLQTGDRVVEIGWSRFWSLSGRDAIRLADKANIPAVLRWSLNDWNFSEYGVYLGQAGAAVRYLLHAEGGKHRPALLKAIAAHYTGDRKGVAPETAFGLKPAELGRKTLDFAKAVAKGWRPGDKG